MVRLRNTPPRHPNGGNNSHRIGYGGGGGDDMASYITDTSSITNPVELELGFSYSQDEEGGSNNDDVSFLDSATSALTGLTGWTSGNGNNNTVGNSAAAVVLTKRGMNSGHVSAGSVGLSELGGVSETENNNYPTELAQQQSMSQNYSGVESVSELGDTRISAFSFDLNGSVETSLDDIDASSGYAKTKGVGGGKGNNKGPGRSPLSAIKKGRDNKNAARHSNDNDDSSVFSTSSRVSNASKKRAPVPPLRDPTMEDTEEDQMWEEDCNYDINPTLMFLVLESHDWKESIALLDGKGLENKDDAWNLGQLFGGGKRREQEKEELHKKRKKELRTQARTWIIRRERNGILRWRMLPLHAALAFNAPFEVVIRLYHLYPGAVRCRNDQGMLPLHHCFKYGNEDKVLEMLLDVFPEALTVVDDRGRLPLACTPQDGDDDNARRSNILNLFSKFQVEMALKEVKEKESDDNVEEKEGAQPQVDPTPEAEPADGCLGAAPRYTTSTDYNKVTYNTIKAAAPTKKQQPEPPSPSKKDDDEVSLSDKYAMLNNLEDGENIPLNGARLGLGLLTIPENETLSPKARKALQSELMELGEKKKRRGIKKLFGKKGRTQVSM